MDRREMLAKSLRDVADALPMALGFAGGLGGLLKITEDPKEKSGAKCFPKKRLELTPDEITSSSEDSEKSEQSV